MLFIIAFIITSATLLLAGEPISPSWVPQDSKRAGFARLFLQHSLLIERAGYHSFTSGCPPVKLNKPLIKYCDLNGRIARHGRLASYYSIAASFSTLVVSSASYCRQQVKVALSCSPACSIYIITLLVGLVCSCFRLYGPLSLACTLLFHPNHTFDDISHFLTLVVRVA
jgi:hypothetical protein